MYVCVCGIGKHHHLHKLSGSLAGVDADILYEVGRFITYPFQRSSPNGVDENILAACRLRKKDSRPWSSYNI